MTTLKSLRLVFLLLATLLAFHSYANTEFLDLARQLQANLPGTAPTTANSTNNTVQPEFITVHLVAHTHNDAGWIATAQSYFDGNWRGCVKCIIDAVVDGLKNNPARKFVYVEQYFFKKWWNLQNDQRKDLVRELVRNGQLEFLNGGFVMNDEGCTYYDDIIEQMTLGHRFIKETFNKTVNAGWHIDPFGHSSAQARLFSEMGFDFWAFERIDSEDFENRKRTGELETIWRPETYNTNKNYLLAHVNFMKYYLAPFGYCITVFCGGADRGTGQRYAEWIKQQVPMYGNTKHVLHQIGGDFEWRSAEWQFSQLQNVIDFYDKNPEFGIKAKFSTPSIYAKDVYEEITTKNITISQKSDDFFPYRDAPEAFWTGYFTSKPFLKKSIRDASRYLQSVKKLLSKLYLKNKIKFDSIGNFTTDLEEALAILQHHDGATGTAKKFVDADYENILSGGYQSVHKTVLPYITTQFAEEHPHPQTVAEPFVLVQQNLTALRLAQTKTAGLHVAAYVYNPSQIQTRVVRFPVPSGSGTIKTDKNDTKIDYNLICEVNKTNCDAVFVDQIGTNQLKLYKWFNSETQDDTQALSSQTLSLGEGVDYRIRLFNNESLFIKKGSAANFEYVTGDEVVHPFSLNYGFYKSFQKKDGGGQRSGAYIFRAQNQTVSPYGSAPSSVQIKRGSQVIEVTIKREGSVTTRLRFYNTSALGSTADSHMTSPLFQTIEIETVLEAIPVADGVGKEVVLIVDGTGIKNNGSFYTNANGLENLKRTRNSKVRANESVAGNYYPINSAIYIEDYESGARVTLLNDRSQGGSSIQDGEIEVMINRRILEDDDRGVDEAHNDDRVLEVKHWLTFAKGPLKQRILQYDFDTQPLIYVATASQIGESSVTQTVFPHAVKVDLVKFYIRVYSETEMLIRLHNMRDDQGVYVREFVNKEMGACITLQSELLERQLPMVKVTGIREVTLTTVQDKHEMLKKKYKWNGIGLDNSMEPDEHGSEQFQNVLLGPLEERVFVLTYSL